MQIRLYKIKKGIVYFLTLLLIVTFPTTMIHAECNEDDRTICMCECASACNADDLEYSCCAYDTSLIKKQCEVNIKNKYNNSFYIYNASIPIELDLDILVIPFCSVQELRNEFNAQLERANANLEVRRVIFQAKEELTDYGLLLESITLDGGNYLQAVIRNPFGFTITPSASLELRNITLDNTPLAVRGTLKVMNGTLIQNTSVGIDVQDILANVFIDGGRIYNTSTGIHIRAGDVHFHSGSIDHNRMGIEFDAITSEPTSFTMIGGSIHNNEFGVQYIKGTKFTVGGTARITNNQWFDVNMGVDQTFVICRTFPPQPQMLIGFIWNNYDEGAEIIWVQSDAILEYVNLFVPNLQNQRVFYEDGIIGVDNAISIRMYRPWSDAGYYSMGDSATFVGTGLCCHNEYEVSNIYHVNRGVESVEIRAHLHCEEQFVFIHWGFFFDYEPTWLDGDEHSDVAVIQAPIQSISMGAFIVDRTLYEIMNEIREVEQVKNRNDADRVAKTVIRKMEREKSFDHDPPVDMPADYVNTLNVLKIESGKVNHTDKNISLIHLGEENNCPEWYIRINNLENIKGEDKIQLNLDKKNNTFKHYINKNETKEELFKITLTNTKENNATFALNEHDKAYIEIEVDEIFESKKMIVLHERSDTLEIDRHEITVNNGTISLNVDTFSYFLILSVDEEQDDGSTQNGNDSSTNNNMGSTDRTSPNTEDTTQLLWITIMLIFSGAIVIGRFIMMRKNSKKE